MKPPMPTSTWYTLHAWTENPDEEICADVSVDEKSPWFSGHFPENPILPGIAQLNMVARVIALSTQENLCIKQLSRVKFKNLVRPNDMLKIRAKRNSATNDLVYSFRITNQTQDVCLGTIVLFAKPEAETDTPMTIAINDTITQIAEIIINELKLEDVTPQTFNPDLDLVDEVGIDSMDLATIALVIRDEFGIRIDEDDYPKLTTIRIIAEYIAEKRSSDE